MSTEVLSRCTVEGTTVKLPNEVLDRKVYLEVKKSLELIGGKWKGGKVQGFQFSDDPTDLLAEIAGGAKRNLKKEFQFFGTSDELADELVADADLYVCDKILEPSAGQGAIVKAIFRKIPGAWVDYCELMPVNRKFIDKILPKERFMGEDFLSFPPGTLYDKIIANPPFSKNQDIDHIYHMYKHLCAGGRLVTIASRHWQYSSNKKEKTFYKWLSDVGADITQIEAGAFEESGTKIATCKIIIEKQ